MQLKPKRLLFTVEHFAMRGSGAENYAVNLCRRLAEREYEVHVLAETAGEVQSVELHRSHARLPQVREQVQPDLVIDWGFFGEADIYRLGGGVHEIYLRHSLNACRGPGRLLKQLSHSLPKHRNIIAHEHRWLDRPDTHFLANSHFTAAQAREACFNKDRICVLHNGVDTQRFRPEPCDQCLSLREQWGATEQDTVFLFVAHNLGLKNLALMRRVFDRLERPDAKLVVVGKREPGFRAPYLTYAGPATDAAPIYRAGDVLVHPTFFDACANVILEAMSSGLPVIVSDCSGAGELVTDGVDGFVRPVANVPPAEIEDAWTASVCSLLDDPEQRREMGSAARTAMAQQDMARYVERFEEYIGRIFSAKRGKS